MLSPLGHSFVLHTWQHITLYMQAKAKSDDRALNMAGLTLDLRWYLKHSKSERLYMCPSAIRKVWPYNAYTEIYRCQYPV